MCTIHMPHPMCFVYTILMHLIAHTCDRSSAILVCPESKLSSLSFEPAFPGQKFSPQKQQQQEQRTLNLSPVNYKNQFSSPHFTTECYVGFDEKKMQFQWTERSILNFLQMIYSNNNVNISEGKQSKAIIFHLITKVKVDLFGIILKSYFF